VMARVVPFVDRERAVMSVEGAPTGVSDVLTRTEGVGIREPGRERDPAVGDGDASRPLFVPGASN